MDRRLKMALAVGLVAVIAVSSLLIYENSALNPAGSSVSWQHPIENFATALTTDAGNVFTMDINGNVNSYSARTGESIWNGSSVGNYFASGLAIADGRVFGGSRYATVGCIDEQTGQLLWSQFGRVDSSGSPDKITVRDGHVFAVTTGTGACVIARNSTSGELLWQAYRDYGLEFGRITKENVWSVGGFPLDGESLEGTFVNALGSNQEDSSFFKLNGDNGSVVWRINYIVSNHWPTVLGSYQGQVIVENGSEILSLSQESGSTQWRYTVNATVFSSTIYKGQLLFGASDGNLYALNLQDGAQVWKTNVDSQNLFPLVNGGNITSTTSPIQVENGRLYWSFGVTRQLGTNSDDKHDTYSGAVCCLDLSTGNLVWSKQFEDNGAFYNPPAGFVINKDTVYLTENTALWVFNAQNGNLARTQQFDHYVLPPVKASDQVFIAADLQLTAYA
jgi:outer membrane protein assembly factor BamB